MFCLFVCLHKGFQNYSLAGNVHICIFILHYTELFIANVTKVIWIKKKLESDNVPSNTLPVKYFIKIVM